MGIFKVYGHTKGASTRREFLVAAYVHAKTAELAMKYTRLDFPNKTITKAKLMS